MSASRQAARALQLLHSPLRCSTPRRLYAASPEPSTSTSSPSQARYVRSEQPAPSSAPAKTSKSRPTDVKGKGKAKEEPEVRTTRKEEELPTLSATATRQPFEALPDLSASEKTVTDTPVASTSTAVHTSEDTSTSSSAVATAPATGAATIGAEPEAMRNPFLSLNTKHPFSTHDFVRTLVEGGVPPDRAEVLMEICRALAQREMLRAQSTLTSKVSMDNDTFLYRAAQAELKNQVQEDTREATLGQRSANARVHRKIELLRQSMNEDLEAAKTEHKYEIQQNRHETSADFKAHDMRSSTISNRIPVLSAEARYLDERLKFFLGATVLITVLSVYFQGYVIAVMHPEEHKLPTIEDLGVQPLSEDRYTADYDAGHQPTKRVGEEDET